MKKSRILILFIALMMLVLVLITSSCANILTRWDLINYNPDPIADKTFGSLMDAVKSKNASKMIDLFTETIQSDAELAEQAEQFIAFVEGDIVSYTSAAECGTGVDTEIQDGKTRRVIQPIFTVTTTENKYYVAMKECTQDDGDKSGVGVLSIYIIEDTNWNSDYRYCGDGKWTPGINIEK